MNHRNLFLFIVGSITQCTLMQGAPCFAENLDYVYVEDAEGVESNLKRKLVTIDYAAVNSEPGGRGTKTNVTPNNIFFQLRTAKGSDPMDGYYKIASPGGRTGWIKASKVRSWNTRYALKPMTPRKAEGDYFEIRIPQGKIKYDDSAVPEESQQYCLVTDQPKDERNGPFDVILFTAKSEGHDEDLERMYDQQNLAMEIVFVVELTELMGTKYGERRLIDTVKSMCKEFHGLAKNAPPLEDGTPRVRLGLVGFQDANKGATMRTPRVLHDLRGGNDAWLGSVNGLSSSDIIYCSMDGARFRADMPEDALSGIYAAMGPKAGWAENSTKHIVLIGCSAFQEKGSGEPWTPSGPKLSRVLKQHFMNFLCERGHSHWSGRSEWGDRFGYNTCGKTLDALKAEAHPIDGSPLKKLQATKYFHAVFAGKDPTQRLGAAELKERIEKDENARDQLVNGELDLTADEWYETWWKFRPSAPPATPPDPKSEDAEVFDWYVKGFDARLMEHWSDKAIEHYKIIPEGNVSGFHDRIDPDVPGDSERVAGALKDEIDGAFKALAALQNPELAKDDRSKGKMAEAVWIFVDAETNKNQPISEDVRGAPGVASIRGSSGRKMGNRCVMVSESELAELRSTLQAMYESFDKMRARAKRKNVGDVLSQLKKILATQAAGQKSDEELTESELGKLITSLPLRTEALKMNARRLTAMRTEAFNEWLEDINRASDRIQTTKQTADSGELWFQINSLDNNAMSADKQFAFIRVSDLP